MSEASDDPRKDGLHAARQPADVFSHLRERPTPELNSDALWRRIEARLEPRRASRGAGWLFAASGRAAFAMRFAYGAASIVGIALVVWMASTFLMAPTEEARFVMLTPDVLAQVESPEPGGGASSPGAAVSMHLDVRLVRGWDGARPGGVSPVVVSGAGGVDALRDVRPRIETLLPFESYGMVGAWEGPVAIGEALDIALADGYRLIAGSTETSTRTSGVLLLNAVELVGSDSDSVAADLSLEPGRLYILGVLAPGAETPDLALLIRARTMAQER